jgi:hypothetical protein
MISPAEMGKIMFENFDSHKEAIIKLMKFVQEKSHIDDVYMTTNSYSNVGFTESDSQENYSYKLLPLENRERLEIEKIEKEEKKSENDCPIYESVKPIKNPPPFHAPIGIDTTNPYAKPYSNTNNSEHQTVENILPDRLKLTNYSCENILPANLFDYRTNY